MIQVKNQKVITLLSARSLKANRVRNAVAVFAIALTTLLFTALFTITGTMIYTSQQQTFRQVGGSFHGGFKNLTPEEKEMLQKDPMIQESGSRLMLGRAGGEEFRKVQAEISYMDEVYRKYSFCTPEYGRAPEEGTKEIACDTRVLQCLGVEPEIGAELTMTYEIGGMEKEEITDTFLLSGWWEFDAAGAGMASMALLPKSYVEEIINTYPVDLTDDSNSTGTWSLDVFLSSSLRIEQDLLQILENNGYQADDRQKENYIGIGVNWGYMTAQMSETYDFGTITGMAAFVVLIIMTGYLIIFNIFQISVSGDIRFYGLLKTIGTTGKQIRRMIRRQAIRLSAMGIPIGLLLGYFTGTILAPLIISTSSINERKTYQVFQPWFFIGAAAFSLATVLLSCAKPGRIASKVSPVEAVRYTDVLSGRKRKKRRSSKTNIFRMAQANLGRNKRKTFLVVISLSLAVVLLQATYTLAMGFDMDKYLKELVVSDFILGDAAYFQYHYRGSDQALPEADILAMEEGGEITERGRIYGGSAFEYVTEDLYREYFEGTDTNLLEEMLAEEERDADGKVKINADFYGMEDFPLSQLEVLDGSIEDLYDPEKNAIAAVYMGNEYGAAIEGSQWAKVGDTVKVRYVYEWEYADAITGEIIPEEEAEDYEKEVTVREKEYQDVSYQVAACVTVKNAMSYRFYGSHQFVLNSKVYQKNSRTSDVMIYMFNTKKEDNGAMQSYLENYTERINPVLNFESKQRYADEFEEYRNMFLVVGGGLSFVIGLIGILNFFNAILTSIYSRRREFAMLQSIGMTGRQLKQMLICEGLTYGVSAIFISAVLSFLAGSLLDDAIGSMFWFFTYRFTLLPVFIVVPIFAALGIFLPLASYKNVTKQTIVERLRIGE